MPLLNIINVKVNLVLKEHTKQKQILEYIKQNSSLVYINKAIGLADVEVEFHFEDIEQLHQTVNDIKKKFPDIIRNYTYFINKKTHKKD